MLSLVAQQGIVKQHGHSHRPYSFGHRSNRFAFFFHVFKIDITNKALIFAVDANIDDNSPLLDQIRFDKSGNTDSRDQNIGLPREGCEMWGVCMDNANSCVTSMSILQQKRR